MLKIGAKGPDVADLQRLLTAAGFPVPQDGWFGPATRAAVLEAQHAFGLVEDGIAGPKTLATLRARPDRLNDKLLRDYDLQIAALTLGVPLPTLRAVNEIESRGEGFLPDGRPVILFERHIMYRRLQAAGRHADGIAAQHPDVVNASRGGYLGGAPEHDRLHAAMRIDPATAIESTSWGLFQIMGFHWRKLGYPSAQQFAARMAASETDQLGAFVRFITANPELHRALRARRWATFARLYNGRAYRENLYDVKLARAYARYADAAETAGEPT